MYKIKGLILIIIVMLIFATILPYSVYADEIDLSNYTSSTLKEAFEEEGIEYDFSNYNETDNQATIYLFRGHGCAYCSKFLTYLADTLLDKYGDYFKVVTYEVWYDSSNSDLMDQVANFMGDDASGVPYIIIGDKTFTGYSESMNSEIESAIKDLYDSEDRYDVFKEIAKSSTETNSKTNTSTNVVPIIIWDIVITIISIIIIIYNNNKNKKEINEQLDELKSYIKKTKKN